MSTTMLENVQESFAQAVHYHQGGRAAEAEALYRQVIEAQPDCAAALNNLGLLVPREEALALFRRAVAAEPEYVDALLNLSGALYNGNDLRGADLFYQRVVALIPETGEDLFRLGRILQLQGRDYEAIEQYERGLAVTPGMTGALCNIGALHGKAGRQDKATAYLRRALETDPASNVLNYNMATVLKQQGRLKDAAECGARMTYPQPLTVSTAPEHRRVVLVATALAGNVPTEILLPARTNTLITWHVEYATDEQEAALPAYDVAFNAIGNPDILDDALPRLRQFHACRPMLNDPDAVAQTRRDRLPHLLAGLPGVVVPAVLRVERDALNDPGLLARLEAAGVIFPLLVRPIMGHGGEGVSLVADSSQLAELDLPEADAYYFIAYHDCRLADGYFRKYRAVFVDRVPYAYHLAISSNWLVHYFSADMLSEPWKREEEARYLQDPAAALGVETWDQIAAIGQRLDLDYAGVDFAIAPDGRVLVFEANATMSVHLNDSQADFPHKHTHVPAIFDAFEALLTKHEVGGQAESCSQLAAGP